MSFNHRAKFGVAAAVLTTWVLACPQPASCDDIFNTFGAGLTYSTASRIIFDSTDVMNGADQYTYGVLAQGFRAPSFQTRLDQVSAPFLMDNVSANISPVTLSIFNGEDFFDNGPPYGMIPYFLGQQVANLSNRSVLVGGVPGQPTVFTYTSASPVLLEADTFYWVVAQVTRQPGSDARNEWYESAFSHPFFLNYFWGGFPFGDPYDFQSDKYNSILEFSPNGPGLAMRVEATAVPEPTSIVLIVVTSLGIIGYHQRRRIARALFQGRMMGCKPGTSS